MSSSQIYSSQVKSHSCPSQVKSSQESQKLVTGVRLESTINAVIEGIHVHRSVKLFLVLLRGASWGPAKFVHGTYPACEALAVSPQNPCGDSWGPVPASQFTRGAPFRTRGGLELLAAGSVTLALVKGMLCLFTYTGPKIYRKLSYFDTS